jgi:NAD+ synthetase
MSQSIDKRNKIIDSLWAHLVYELKVFFNKTGNQEAVIGLSGGIDSAVVAALCCEALGPDKVLVAMMPSKYSSEGSLSDSQEFIRNFGIPSTNIFSFGVDTVVDAALNQVYGNYSIRPKGEWVEGNLQARTRMMFLMALTNERKGRLVVNTCNLTEDLLGYATMYGDSAGAISPLGNVGKMMVYALANRFNDRAKGNSSPHIPRTIIEKAPSAELAIDQTDEGQLGADYSVLDPVTQALSLGDYLPDRERIALVKKHGAEFISKYEGMMVANKFKMDQAPPAIPLPRHLFNVCTSSWSLDKSVFENTVVCLGIDICNECSEKDCISHPQRKR